MDREYWDAEAAARCASGTSGSGSRSGLRTGTLARLLTDEGYQMDGLDVSPEMVRLARAKVPEAAFTIGDASDPLLDPTSYDVVLGRHVLWAMPDAVYWGGTVHDERYLLVSLE